MGPHPTAAPSPPPHELARAMHHRLHAPGSHRFVGTRCQLGVTLGHSCCTGGTCREGTLRGRSRHRASTPPAPKCPVYRRALGTATTTRAPGRRRRAVGRRGRLPDRNRRAVLCSLDRTRLRARSNRRLRGPLDPRQPRQSGRRRTRIDREPTDGMARRGDGVPARSGGPRPRTGQVWRCDRRSAPSWRGLDHDRSRTHVEAACASAMSGARSRTDGAVQLGAAS